MKSFKNKIRSIWADESAQGATEYILLVVLVVGILAVFGPKIKAAIENKVDNVAGQIGTFGG